MKPNVGRIFLVSIIVLTGVILPVSARDEGRDHFSRFQSSTGEPGAAIMNINHIRYWMRNDGWSGRNPFTGESGVTFQRPPEPVVFQDGFVWGGLVADPNPDTPKLRVGGQTYRIGTVPGRILSPGNAEDPNLPHVHIYRIRKDFRTVSDEVLRRDAADLFYEGDTSRVTPTDIQTVRQQYQADWNDWPVQFGAPFYDQNGNGIYEPARGETPGLANADQVLWFVCNDLEPAAVMGLYGSPPIGLELQVTMWAYSDEHQALQDMVFKRYRLINKSGLAIDSMFVGIWSDPDLGDYTDDFLGCDSVLNYGYCYNSSNEDTGLPPGAAPPAVGYVLLQGPIVPAVGDTAWFNFHQRANHKNLPLTSFWAKATGTPIGDPTIGSYEGTLEMYNLLNGFAPFPDTTNLIPYYHGSGNLQGRPTKFPLNGDPLSGTGDIDGMGNNLPPGARRMALASGSFTMQPGDTQEVVFAVVAGGSKDRIASLSVLRYNTLVARFMHSNGYQVPRRLPEPIVTAAAYEGKIVLDWGSALDRVAAIEQNGGDYRFEGYNVWQLPDESAGMDQAVRIATFDTPEPPSVIFGYQMDPISGWMVYQPVIFGENSGIQRFLEINQDHFTGKPFIDGKEYTFAVTAYRYRPGSETDNPLPVIESIPGKVTIRAQKTNPGYSARFGDTLAVTHSGPGTGKVTVRVINPAQVTGHDYRVVFSPDTLYDIYPILDQNGNIIGSDTVGFHHPWNLVDETSGDTLLASQENVTGEGYYPIVDGLQVIVFSPIFTDIHCKYEGIPWASGINSGENIPTCSGLSFGSQWWSGPNDTIPLHIEFQDSADVAANGFISRGAVYRRDLGYAYAGTGELPLIAFDTSDPDNPRRINISFVEDAAVSQQNGSDANMLWDMGWNGVQFADLGGREYVFFHLSDYNEGADYNDDNWAPGADVAYGYWPQGVPGHRYLENTFTWNVLVSKANSPQDIFRFSAPPPPDVPNRFQVYQNYPNPFNAGTTIRYWVPQRGKVTLEIYNILGQRVTVLVDQVQNKGEYFIRWQPHNIASGVYIYRLVAGGQAAVKKMVLVR